MNISLLNVRITIQKNTVTVDSVGNHINEWTDYFTCAATAAASGLQQKEQQTAGVTSAEEALVFTVRYCSELTDLDTTHYRVRFRDAPYNITSINWMNYDRKSLKLTCEKERRDI
ncbi:MAG: phage head closure protein [Clostridiales bacterium]|nr:phage head closure protein [Clostridiales bacterium]